ncbi:hypothetical protein OR16_03727 [Cupriavidus basilensis OR16]|uniref:Uncharacterized protein n=1 Tax=Cupriavidus basilensis OR16 TaxID=1127483 RepID=H1RZK4_9BURK|nr:hypothetical protein OR16_03727 [Cupriavidus basilensis OR16]
MASNTPFGPAAHFHTGSHTRSRRVAEARDYAIIA